ncbi:metallophosphoesterase (plasmid) [Ruegeria sp. TM1040]|uniref:metallophosphoesterase family protein n=1 Tax=Ruegeria sp. (strain TM1040) TaxID=292414 RepID=UPI0000462CED|nr:DNA repair exonuclease [Ruegeria sp. TM1040]ABF62465.1 metallophosphoesterase [Ruegeria sp. TM1040]MDF9301183.1 DNA repair exonuclease [Tritonibacter mobilis]
MIKILHTADVHLDSPLRSLALRNAGLRETVAAASRAAFSQMIDRALSEEVAAILISGDLFDGRERTARTGAFLLAELDRLAEAGIQVYYIKGNHDAENPITGTLDLPQHVHVFDARGGKHQLSEDVWIHGVSFAESHAPESLLPRFKAPVAGAVNIAMLHSSLAGAAGHDVYAPCSVSDLAAMGFDYWALGHIHKRQIHAEAPWVVMPGIPQGRDIGEAGPKSATLLTIEQGQIALSEVPTSVVEFVETELDVTGAANDEALRATLKAHLSVLSAALVAPTGVVRLTLKGAPARHWQILRDRDVWTEQVHVLAQTCGDLWIDKLIFDLAPEAAQDTSGASDELAATMATICGEPGFQEHARQYVETVLQDLPATLRERLIADEAARDALVARLTQAGADRVLAQMKGAES